MFISVIEKFSNYSNVSQSLFSQINYNICQYYFQMFVYVIKKIKIKKSMLYSVNTLCKTYYLAQCNN